MMLLDEAEICAHISIAPHEAAALADACKARALQIAEETTDNDKRSYYYDLLATAFQAIAMASARSLYINAKDDHKVTAALALEIGHE